MKDFRDRALRGLTWSFASQLGRHIIKFAGTIVLAHLLAPRDFGLIAMTWVAMGLTSILAEMGLGSALVQARDVDDDQLSSVLWLNLACGGTAALLMLASAPWITRLYREPALAPIVGVLSATLLINSACVVPIALLTRNLDFKALAKIEVLSAAVSGPAAVALAALGCGIWSLVGQSLIAAIVTAAASWYFSSWRPRMVFHGNSVRRLMSFGVNLTAEVGLNFLTRNLDNFLIGMALGPTAVGVYSRAYLVMLFPLIAVARVPNRVLFPALSRIQDDPRRVKTVFLKVSRAVALITFPMMMGLFVVVPEFVIVAFGRQWTGMIPLVRILAGVGMLQSITTSVGNLYLSQGRTDLQLKVGLGLKMLILIGIVIGLRWGTAGVAAGYALSWTITAVPTFWFAAGLVGLTMTEFIGGLRNIFLSSSAMALLVWLIRTAARPGLGDAELLALEVAAGAILYPAILHLRRDETWRDVKNIITGRFKPMLAPRA